MSDKYADIKHDAVICFCNSNKAWGGGERWHLESSLYLARQGYRVILACGRGGPLWRMALDELKKDELNKGERGKDAGKNRPLLREKFQLADWRFGNLSFLNPFKGSAFARFLVFNRVTHLILNLPADLKVGVPATGRKDALQQAIKVFYRRGSAIPVKPGGLNGYLFSRLTALIANSRETAECVRQANIMDPARIRVIYNGLDSRAFDAALRGTPDPNDQEEPPVAFSRDHPLIIGNAGRLSRQKGQKYLLHLSAELKRRDFPHKLVIAGEGELRAELEILAAGLQLEPCQTGLFHAKKNFTAVDIENFRAQPGDLVLTGFLQDLSPFWRSIDLFALSSLWEGFGYALAEAMLASRPLLAFDCNSMPELVQDGLNGLLLPPPEAGEDEAAVGRRLADSVMNLAADPAALYALGRAGREFCLENFDQKASMRRLEDLLFENIALPVFSFGPEAVGRKAGPV